MRGDAMRDDHQNLLICENCEVPLRLVAARVTAFVMNEFVDFYQCDRCGEITVHDGKNKKEWKPL
jgi:hypothetical protein